MYYIGADLGTTACKAVLYDGDGNVQAVFKEEYPLDARGGRIFQSADDWFETMVRALRAVARPDVAALSFSTQGISFVPVGSDGQALCAAYSWMDTSAVEQAGALDGRFGEAEIYARTGKPLNPTYTLPKLMLFKAEHPELYGRTRLLLTPLDWLNLKFTGNALTDYTSASGTMLYNIEARRWDGELADFAGIDLNLMPQVGRMGAPVGRVLPDVARRCGLSPDTRVILGGQDQKLAAVGAGLRDGLYTLSIGTASVITCDGTGGAGVPRFAWDSERILYEAVIPYTGAAVKWACKNLLGGVSYAGFDELAAAAADAGGVVFCPDFTGGAALSGLSLSTAPCNIAYAVLEGICREIKKQADALGGADSLVAFGGGASSQIWCRILADTAACEVCRLSDGETASRGAAMLASEGKIPPATIIERIVPKCSKQDVR